MKYLLSAEFKVMRRGEFVEADTSVGEFIYDTEGEAVSNGVAHEIADNNALTVSKKLKKEDYINALNEELSKMEVSEQNTPTESQRVLQIVKDGYDAGKNDDAILIEIVTAGISFKKAAKLFKQSVESLGLRVSTKDVVTQANEILAAIDFAPTTQADVDAAVAAITSKVEKVEAKQALAAIRKYAKTNEITLPEKPKGQRGATAGHGFRNKAFDWIKANPEAKEADFVAWVAAEGKPEPIQKRLAGIFVLVHEFHAAN